MTSCRTGAPAAAGTRRPASPAVRKGYTSLSRTHRRDPHTFPGRLGASGKRLQGLLLCQTLTSKEKACAQRPMRTAAWLPGSPAHSPSPPAPSHRSKTRLLCAPVRFTPLASISFPSDSWVAVEASGCWLPHFESWSRV